MVRKRGCNNGLGNPLHRSMFGNLTAHGWAACAAADSEDIERVCKRAIAHGGVRMGRREGPTAQSMQHNPPTRLRSIIAWM